MLGMSAMVALLLLPTVSSFAASFVGNSRAGGRNRRRGGNSQLYMMETIECDVVIVGGGPAGCTCALYTSRAGHKTVMLDKNPAVGALAITSHIANYPGVEATMSGLELLDKMRDQCVSYGTEYVRAQVFMVEVDGDYKNVCTPAATYRTRALVLATGAMGRPPSFVGEDTYLGQGVSYCATCDGAFYQDSEVVVVGVNREAIEEAMYLTTFASTVHWITATEPKEGILEAAEDLLACPNVKQWKQTRVTLIEGDSSGVTGVRLKQRGSQEASEKEDELLEVEGVFIYVAGSKPITDFIQSEGIVGFKEDGGIEVNEEMETSSSGVFAIGDIRNTPFKQVVVAASDGCVAAMAIDKHLKGRRSVKVDWIHQ